MLLEPRDLDYVSAISPFFFLLGEALLLTVGVFLLTVGAFLLTVP